MTMVAARSSRVVVPHKLKWHGHLAALGIYGVVRGVAGTIRYHLDDRHEVLPNLKSNAIFITWHNRLALTLPFYHRFLRERGDGYRLAALVSASKDGGLLARVLEHFDVQPVRGSSSRRGPQALLELTTWAERGFDLAITPDGPRGPCYKMQDGVMALAQLTGLPIIPAVWKITPKYTVNSWDRFQIPIPFGKAEIGVGKPMLVPRDISDTERNQLKMELQERMIAITRD